MPICLLVAILPTLRFCGLCLVFICLNTRGTVFAQTTDSPQTVTVDGRLFVAGSGSEPLLDASVVLKIQILDSAQTCALYEEEHTISTLTSNGFFNVQVGSAVGDPKRSGLDSANSMTTVFYNRSTAINGQNTSGSCTYTPSSEDVRYFRFFVTPSSVGTTEQLSPDMRLDSVPQALVAQTLQGLGRDDFFKTSVTSTQTRLDNLLTTNYTNITDLIGGTSAMYLRNAATGTVLPTRASDPGSPVAGQLWYDTTANEIKYYNGSAVQSVGAAGAGISSLTAGSGLSGGTITTSGTIAIAAGGVTNAMLASGIDASKITAGTLPVGVVPTNTDTTKLPLAGGTMTGAITLGADTSVAGFNLLNTGHITMGGQKVISIGRYDATEQTTLISTLTGANIGATWYNSTTNKLMYWNGASAFELADTTTAGGDITAINTNAGSGLTGGAASGPITLAIDVDNSTIEISTNTVQVKDSGITAAKLASNAVTSAKILDGEIVNADINATAAIAWTKIDKTGAVAADVGAVPTSRTIATNSGSGLTGGGDLTASRALAINVDNSSIEVATNTVQIKDGGVTNAKIATMNITKLTAGAGDYFSYMPAGTECASGEVLKWNVASDRWECGTDVGVTSHGALSALTNTDDHTQYTLLAGRVGGQTLNGGSAASNNLNIESTSNATKGNIIIQATGGRVGIGTASPAVRFDVGGEMKVGTGATACSATTAGGVRYNSVAPCLEYCDGALWRCVQTTVCASNLPTNFTFTNQANVAVSTLILSNIVQITGINSCVVETSVSGQGTPEYRTCSDSSCTAELQSWTTGRSTIENNQYVQMRLTSSAAGNINHFATLSVGSRSVSWQVSTTGDCTDPSPAVGTICADGTMYAGLSPDTGTKMYTTPCDYGRTWNGTACTGARIASVWSVGATIVVAGLNDTQGEANTAIMVGLANADSPYSAALICDSLTFGGQTDWYLPSRQEGQTLGAGCGLIQDGACADSTDYWSSSQNNASQGRTYRFQPAISQAAKTSNFRMRCVRKD